MKDREFEEAVESETINKCSEILDLLKGSNLSLSEIKEILLNPTKHEKKEKKWHPFGGPVTKVTQIIRNHTCAFCGNTYTTVTELKSGEELGTLTTNGIYQVSTVKGPYNLDCYTKRCSKCFDKMEPMSRERLMATIFDLLIYKPFPK